MVFATPPAYTFIHRAFILHIKQCSIEFNSTRYGASNGSGAFGKLTSGNRTGAHGTIDKELPVAEFRWHEKRMVDIFPD